LAGNKQVIGRSLRPNVELECTDRTETETLERWDQSASKKALRELQLRTTDEVVATKQVILALRGGGLGSG